MAGGHPSQKILSGAAKLTPALAKALGLPFEDGALLDDRKADPNRRVMDELDEILRTTA